MNRWQRNLALPVTIVAIGLGFLISLQLQTQKSVSAAQELQDKRTESIKVVLENSLKQNEALKAEHEKLTSEIEETRKAGGVSSDVLAEITQVNIMNGTQEVMGTGIEMTLDDRVQEHKTVIPVSVEDLSNLVNTLRYAGAEAISINGQRIVASTAIVNSGSYILINKSNITKVEGAPYVIQAIGRQDSLADYAKIVANELKVKNSINISITRKSVQIPSYKGPYNFKYGQASDSGH